MSLLCKISIHTWDGCKCTKCGKTKDEASNKLSSKHDLENTESRAYKTVKIGDEEWMAENLNIECYRNGDIIPEVQDEDEWRNLKTGAWCYYENDPKNNQKYGKLYNWYAVNDKRGLSPEGWHIPTYIELQTLETTLSSNCNALKEKGQGMELGAGTNTSGFSALLAGYRNNSNFYDLAYYTYFWTSTEYNETNAYDMTLNFNNSYIDLFTNSKSCGFSIRCLKDRVCQEAKI